MKVTLRHATVPPDLPKDGFSFTQCLHAVGGTRGDRRTVPLPAVSVRRRQLRDVRVRAGDTLSDADRIDAGSDGKADGVPGTRWGEPGRAPRWETVGENYQAGSAADANSNDEGRCWEDASQPSLAYHRREPYPHSDVTSACLPSVDRCSGVPPGSTVRHGFKDELDYLQLRHAQFRVYGWLCARRRPAGGD